MNDKEKIEGIIIKSDLLREKMIDIKSKKKEDIIAKLNHITNHLLNITKDTVYTTYSGNEYQVMQMRDDILKTGLETIQTLIQNLNSVL